MSNRAMHLIVPGHEAPGPDGLYDDCPICRVSRAMVAEGTMVPVRVPVGKGGSTPAARRAAKNRRKAARRARQKSR